MDIHRIDKPWGYEEWLYVGDGYAVKRLFMVAGHSCSLQYHEEKHETIYVLKGVMDFAFGSRGAQLAVERLTSGDCRVIPPGKVHRMSAVEDCTYLEASTPQLDDVVRLADDYGRD